MKKENVKKKIIQIWKNLLKKNKINCQQDFYELGGSSFLAIQLLYIIKENFSIELLPIHFIKRPLTIDYLVKILTSSKNGLLENKIFKDTYLRDLKNIKRSNFTWQFYKNKKIKTIFLTGASGFVGVHLLGSIMKNTDYVVYCLIHGINKKESSQKIQNAILYYKLVDIDTKRIKIVNGDLAQKYFGLSPVDFESLAQKIDVIVHAGAIVNFEMSYEDLRSTNIDGTSEILRLSSTHKAKVVHYISSLSVLGFNHYKKENKFFTEGCGLNRKPIQAYAQTKLIAEKSIQHAMKNGLQANIYRLGEIASASTTGIPNCRALHHLFVRACKIIGFYPKSTIKIDYLPVDFVGDFIIKIIKQENKKFLGKVFQICHPRGISFNKIFEMLIKQGNNIKPLSGQEFLKCLKKQSTSVPEISILKLFVEKQNLNNVDVEDLFLRFFLYEMKSVSIKNTKRMMNMLKMSFPVLDNKTLSRYIAFLNKSYI